MGNESSSKSSTFGNSAGEAIMGRIVLIAIVVLFMTVLFVLLLHLYARLFWWRVEQQLQRHHQRSQPGSTTARRQRRRFIFAQGQDPSRTAGLDPSVLLSIPVVVFKLEDFKDGLECAVCLSELADGDKARLLPNCKHGFHVDCIDMWFQCHSTCPLCRNIVGSVGGTSEHEDANTTNTANDHVGLSQNQDLGSGYVSNHQNSSQNPNSNPGFSTEPPNFPTNVLVWGDQNQVNSTGIADVEDSSNGSSSGNATSSNDHQSSTSSTNNINRTQDGTALVIDIPTNATENLSSTPSARFVEEDAKSPVFKRLRSLKRLLSREKRGVVTSCGSTSSTNV